MSANAWNVTFVNDYYTLTTTVALVDDPDASNEEIVSTADALILDVAGFSPLRSGCDVYDIERLEDIP